MPHEYSVRTHKLIDVKGVLFISLLQEQVLL